MVVSGAFSDPPTLILQFQIQTFEHRRSLRRQTQFFYLPWDYFNFQNFKQFCFDSDFFAKSSEQNFSVVLPGDFTSW